MFVMKKWFGLVPMVGVVIACGDDGPRGIGQDTDTGADSAADTSGETSSDATAEDTGDTSDTSDAIDIDDTSAPDTTPTALPNACDAGTPCSAGVCRSGVCVVDPPAAAVSHVTDPTVNEATTEWPDLDCVDQSLAPPTASATATLYGAVARFGKGRKTTSIKVEVLLAEGFDPSACEDASGAAAKRECYRGYGTPIGSALSVPATPETVPAECVRHEDCPLGYQCFDPNELGGSCEEQFGVYEITEVPLDTPLVIRSYATTNEAQWHDTWMFNVILHSERVADGRIQYDAQMVSEGSGSSRPTRSGCRRCRPTTAPSAAACATATACATRGRSATCASGSRPRAGRSSTSTTSKTTPCP